MLAGNDREGLAGAAAEGFGVSREERKVPVGLSPWRTPQSRAPKRGLRPDRHYRAREPKVLGLPGRSARCSFLRPPLDGIGLDGLSSVE
jgi:hypothetical protein